MNQNVEYYENGTGFTQDLDFAVKLYKWAYDNATSNIITKGPTSKSIKEKATTALNNLGYVRNHYYNRSRDSYYYKWEKS